MVRLGPFFRCPQHEPVQGIESAAANREGNRQAEHEEVELEPFTSRAVAEPVHKEPVLRVIEVKSSREDHEHGYTHKTSEKTQQQGNGSKAFTHDYKEAEHPTWLLDSQYGF